MRKWGLEPLLKLFRPLSLVGWLVWYTSFTQHHYHNAVSIIMIITLLFVIYYQIQAP